MKLLLTGGAGYIGSHMTYLLIEKGFDVIIIDNLSTGFEKLIHPKAQFIKCDISDQNIISNLIKTEKPVALFHFAGSVRVDESMLNPELYYLNNTFKSLQLFQCCHENGLTNIIFSSTAAVYGDNPSGKINESALLSPKSPYGHSKLMTEQILKDLSEIYNLRYCILRYFNVAGCNNNAGIGQYTENANHLIKVSAEAAVQKRKSVLIFGTDYNTPDGTGVRDYIHVEDLISAHLHALEYLIAGGKKEIFNLGYGHGFSVRQVISAMQKVSHFNFPVVETLRREGDIASSTADSSKARQILNWKPQFDNIDQICKSAFDWENDLLNRP